MALEKDWQKKYALKPKQLAKIGKEEGLSGKRLKVYVGFMRRRLPYEAHSPYAREWAQRFMRGSQYNMGDIASRRAMLAEARKLKYPTRLIKIRFGHTLAMWKPNWKAGDKAKVTYVNERTGNLYYR